MSRRSKRQAFAARRRMERRSSNFFLDAFKAWREKGKRRQVTGFWIDESAAIESLKWDTLRTAEMRGSPAATAPDENSSLEAGARRDAGPG